MSTLACSMHCAHDGSLFKVKKWKFHILHINDLLIRICDTQAEK